MDLATTEAPPPTRPRGRRAHRENWTVTAAGRRALDRDPADDLTREQPLPDRMSPMTDPDLAPAFARVDLLLDEALLALARVGYPVGDAVTETGDRLHTAAARVRNRLAVERDVRAAGA